VKSYGDEKVFVVPRAELLGVVRELPSGFEAFGAANVDSVYVEAMRRWGRFVPRVDAEENPAWKQIIPYCLLVSAGQIFLMQRRRGGGEARLHDKLSLGVGGHINPVDSEETTDAGEIMATALRRELREELWLAPGGQVPECIGVLNDDSDPVGQVHLGMVYRLEVEAANVTVREHESLEGQFVEPGAVFEALDRLESWSRMLATSLWQARTEA